MSASLTEPSTTPAIAPVHVICDSCFNRIRSWSKFCKHCGAKNQRAVPAPPQPAAHVLKRKPTQNRFSDSQPKLGLQQNSTSPVPTTLNDDIQTKQELLYNPELERMARNWVERGNHSTVQQSTYYPLTVQLRPHKPPRFANLHHHSFG